MAHDLLDRPTRAQVALAACQRSLRTAAEALAAISAHAGEELAESQRARLELEEAIRQHQALIEIIVHDQITLLTAIKGWAQLLQRRVWRARMPETAAMVQLLAQIDRTATQMAEQLRALEADLDREGTGASDLGA